MGGKLSRKGELTIEAIKKFQNKGATRAGIARYLHETYPLIFHNTENARQMIKLHTGSNGERSKSEQTKIYDLG